MKNSNTIKSELENLYIEEKKLRAEWYAAIVSKNHDEKITLDKLMTDLSINKNILKKELFDTLNKELFEKFPVLNNFIDKYIKINKDAIVNNFNNKFNNDYFNINYVYTSINKIEVPYNDFNIIKIFGDKFIFSDNNIFIIKNYYTEIYLTNLIELINIEFVDKNFILDDVNNILINT